MVDGGRSMADAAALQLATPALRSANTGLGEYGRLAHFAMKQYGVAPPS